MSVILWGILALGLLAIVIAVAGYRTRAATPPLELPPGELFPSTALQRMTRWSLGLGVVPLVAAAVIVGSVGTIAWEDDDATRLLVTVLLLAAMIILVIPTMVAGTWAARDDGRLDERDRTILARAPTGQAAAILVILAIWTIALQETYRGTPGIPHTYLHLIFWSCLEVSLLASNVGILLGYRRP